MDKAAFAAILRERAQGRSGPPAAYAAEPPSLFVTHSEHVTPPNTASRDGKDKSLQIMRLSARGTRYRVTNSHGLLWVWDLGTWVWDLGPAFRGRTAVGLPSCDARRRRGLSGVSLASRSARASRSEIGPLFLTRAGIARSYVASVATSQTFE
jgi:hypothetical protein